MPILSPRHWFQVKLSTWFVLVAILAWAMIEWPWVIQTHDWISSIASPQQPFVFQSSELRKGVVRLETGTRVSSTGVSLMATAGKQLRFVDTWQFNPALIHPALALAAFVGWKAAWAIGQRVAASEDS